MATTRETILNTQDTRIEAVEVPEWPGIGRVYVRSMSGRLKDAYEQWCLDCKNNNEGRVKNGRGMMAALTVCEADGAPVFTPDDAEALGQKDAAPLDRILEVAMRLNGMDAKAAADLEKNSGSGQTGDSVSGSPHTSE